MTPSTTSWLEQAYAPPFSSAKDPVAMAAYVAENVLTHRMQPLYWRELRDADPSAVTLLDVRTELEFGLGSLPGAVNIPLDDLRNRLDELPADKPIFVFCGVGLRGYLASNILQLNGFTDVRNLVGGLKVYKAATATLPEPVPFASCAPAEKSEQPTPVVQTQPVALPASLRLDACGLSCPGPIMKLKNKLDSMEPGQSLEVIASDPGFPRDAESWCETTGNTFVSHTEQNGRYCVCVTKGTPAVAPQSATATPALPPRDGKTFIMFSDDLDKAQPPSCWPTVLLPRAKKVTIFFTFWGLNVIKKQKQTQGPQGHLCQNVWHDDAYSDSTALKLSKMNMGGMGRRMMRYIMNRKGIDSLESLRQQAIDNGVEFIACQMSMDVMGVSRDELLDNVTIGGVATYMNRAE